MRGARARAASVIVVAALAATATACRAGSTRTYSATHVADPPKGIAAEPEYSAACAPSGLDSAATCLEVTLQAIDNARAKEHVKPMALPADFPRLGVPEQLFVAVNRERVDRGLPALAGLSDALNAVAKSGADAGELPPDPNGYSSDGTLWLGAAVNGLDAVYAWMYDDGPGSGVDGCAKKGDRGCWGDRHILLDDYGPTPSAVMGAAVNPTGDTDPSDPGGPSLAAVLAVAPSANERLTYTWAEALAAADAGTLRPRSEPPADASATHIADPPGNLPGDPDFTAACAPSGLDSSPRCLAAVLQAFNNARAKEGVKPLVLPADFGRMSVPEQLFAVINRERVDRGLPPAVGRTAALDRNAQAGADQADDPPDPGDAYDVVDGLWAGGSWNGLDAVYGFMYDDGPGSTNIDCPAKGGPGCWGHRHGILDNFGTVGTLIMGTAVNPTGDTYPGDEGGTSMGVTLAVTTRPTGPLVQTWDSVVAATPGK